MWYVVCVYIPRASEERGYGHEGYYFVFEDLQHYQKIPLESYLFYTLVKHANEQNYICVCFYRYSPHFARFLMRLACCAKFKVERVSAEQSIPGLQQAII